MFDFFYYYGYGYFSYLIFMLPALVISLWAQISVKSTFHKYSELRTGRGLTGAQAAQEAAVSQCDGRPLRAGGGPADRPL